MDLSFIHGLVGFIVGLSAQYPVLVGVFSVLYIVGIAFKIAHVALTTYVLETPSKKDDEFAKNLEENKIFKGFKFVADLLIRLKIK